MPQPLRRSQEWLLKRIQALGYDVNFEGMCYGISSMMIQANLLDDKKTYIERLTKMAAIPVTRFKETVEALPAQQKADIHAFCNGVVLYQDPHKFKHSVFENNQTNLAFNTNEAHSLLKPVALDDGARKIARLPPIQGAYQLSELQTYLRKLREHLGEVNFTAGIASEAHAMYLSYDGTQKQWFFLDPNAMPGETFTQVEEEKLAQTIEKGFSNHGTTIFTSTIYADNYAIESHLKHALPKLLSDGSWQALHQVSKDNALLKDSRNSSLLSLYCRDGNVKAIKELLPQLDKGELLKQNKRGNTAFNFAIYNDNKTLINLLLDKFSLTDLSADGLGRDLLTKACLDGSLNATEALLKRVDKATINTLYSDNQTFINAAIKGGKPELIDLFLAHGIDSDYLNKLDNNGWTPLMHACQTGAKSMVDKLLTHLTPEQINTFSDTSPLLLAAGSGNSELLKELLADERFSKQIDKTTPDGNNIFMAACQGGDVASVAILLQDQRFQSQVTAKNHAELSALDLAAAKGQQEIINQLLAANRGLNVQSALLTACKHG
jgi:ankyrin repeat protein